MVHAEIAGAAAVAVVGSPGTAGVLPPMQIGSVPRRRDPRWPAIGPPHRETPERAHQRRVQRDIPPDRPDGSSVGTDPLAPVVDDLPQGLADTVADLIGRPRARGWIHLCSAVTATVGGLALVSAAAIASSQKAILATLIYTVTIVAMFSVSAIYHRKHWHNPVGPEVDEAARPLGDLRVHRRQLHTLRAAWRCRRARSRSADHRVDRRGGRRGAQDVVAVRAAVGRRAAVPATRLGGDLVRRSLLDGGGPIVVGLLVLGGVLYNVGAILYGFRWPNPWPHTFGYHEFFHAFTALRR